MDINYYKKINGSYGKTKEETKISQIQNSYDKNYDNTLSTFEILKDTKRADTVYINLDKENTASVIIDYNTFKKTKQDIIPFLEKELWITSNLIKTGDYITYTNKYSKIEETYLITGKVEARRGYDDCYITECKKTAKIMLSKDTMINLPVIKEYKSMYSTGLQDNKTMLWGDTCLSLTIQENELTKRINKASGLRVIMDDLPWKITDVKKNDGTLELTCLEDTISENDDFDNQIADRWKYDSKPSYEFIYDRELTFNINTELDLNIIIKNNGVEVTNPILTITSSDETVVKYANDKLTGLSVGSSVLTIQYQGVDKVHEFIVNVNIINTVVSTHTYNVTSSDNTYVIQQFIANIFTCNRKDDDKGIYAEYDISVDYNGNSTSCVAIEDIGYNYIQIRYVEEGNKTIYVVFKDKETNIETKQEITLVGY